MALPPEGYWIPRYRSSRPTARRRCLPSTTGKLRIEYKVRGNTITIYECRPPWRKGIGPDWTRMRICTFEWDPSTRSLDALCTRPKQRRLEYPFIEPAPDLAPLVRDLDNDPTCIFWG